MLSRDRANNTQLVIYGKKGHAEVNGLVGQTEGTAIVIEKIEDLDRLDFTRAISLFSQTTKSLDGFKAVVAEIKQRMAEGVEFIITIRFAVRWRIVFRI